MREDSAPALAALRVALEERRRELEATAPQAGADVALIELERSLETVEAFRVVSSHWPLHWHNLPTRFWAGLNRVLRRYLRWYVDPIVAQQNSFNSVVAQLLNALKQAQDDLRAQGIAPAAATSALSAPTPPGDERFAPLMALVEQRAALEPPASFPELALEPLLRAAEAQAQVQAHWELVGESLRERGLIQVHKLVRRYLRWLVNPLVAQQNAHNAAVCKALAALVARDAELRADLAQRRAVTAALRRGV